MIFAASCAIAVTPAEAQWRLDAQAGRLEYEAGPDVVSTTIALGLSRSSASSSYGASVGVPFSDEEPLWGSLQGFHRLATRGATGAGVDLSGSAFGYRIAARDSTELIPVLESGQEETGWGVGGEVMPFAFWHSASGTLGAELRAGVVAFTSDATTAEHLDRTAFVADASFTAAPMPDVSARVESRYVGVPEGGFPFIGGTIAFTRFVTVWGSLGQWLDDAVDQPSWEAGLSLPIHDRVALAVSGRHDPIDPVYATPARTSWGFGVSVWLGDPKRDVPLPVPDAYEDGVATITLDVDSSGEAMPSIAGDFNAWTPTPMQRDGDAWVYRVPLEPGVYNYAFIDASGTWFVPEGTPGRHDDGMGGHVATLVVSAE